jgi:hypothetical protein
LSTSHRIDDIGEALSALCYQGRGGGGNIHDTEFGCINALLVTGSTTEAAIEEVLAAVSAYAANSPLCARWNWDRERRALERMAYSFVNKFPDYTDRLPPELYAQWRRRRGQGVTDPVLTYDRRRQRWHYPEPEGIHATDAETGNAKTHETGNNGFKANGNGQSKPRIQLIPFDQLRPNTDALYLVDEMMPNCPDLG